MDSLLSILIGVGLAAACGFRVFIPLLVVSVAAQAGHIPLAPALDWIGTPQALVAFATASVLEVAAYFVPWFDHLLDTVAGPAAVIAGVLVAAAVLTDIPPFLKWSLAIIAGGGAAGAIQGTTTGLRATSGVVTGGLGNPLVASLELVGSSVTAVLAIVAPLACVLLLAVFVVVVVRKTRRFLFRKRSS